MLIHWLLISSCIIKGSIVVLMVYGDFGRKVLFSCFFFSVMAGLEGEGHWWCECPALRQREQSFSPHLVPGDSGRCIFSRCAWQGGPHWLNYPAVLVTPTPLFTQMKPQRIDWSDERGNGVGPSCLFLDLVCSFIASPLSLLLSNPNLFKLNNSYGSWFHINDNKIPLHKCLMGYYILCLDKMHWVSSGEVSIWLLWDT